MKDTLKVLVIGQGGREHTIVWKLAQSPRVNKIFCAPGNPGIAELATIVNINELDFAGLAQFVKDEGIDITVVGPEVPLFAGIVDFFEVRGLAIYGPTQKATAIEGSKSFAKDLMKNYNIPTAAYATFSNYEQAWDYVQKQGVPIVIKADGLAAGKGVVVAYTLEEARKALEDMLNGRLFGDAGAEVVVEEHLEGEELTLLSFVDGDVVRPMVPAQDHKTVFDGDKGPNTGGMGTYSPLPQFSQDQIDHILKTIVEPTAKALKTEGASFRGVLYTGLMMTKSGPKVIEFNARFGDPETQVVLSRLESDLIDIIEATLKGCLHEIDITWDKKAAVCVIMAAGGYPGPYRKGDVISGLEDIDGVVVFHAGTAKREQQIVTNGGRVLGVVAKANELQAAIANVYEKVEQIKFEGAHYRKDIGYRALIKK